MARSFISIIFILLFSTAAFADASVQFQTIAVRAPNTENVKGMRFVLLHGKNQKVNGLDLGFASFSESVNQSGFTFNMGISNVKGTSAGCGCSLINIHEGEDTGLNAAFVNIINSAKKGVNVGFVNITEGKSAVDIGGLSMAGSSRTQVGFVNFADKIEGVQIGFLNFADNGFFPMFPFFNYAKK